MSQWRSRAGARGGGARGCGPGRWSTEQKGAQSAEEYANRDADAGDQIRKIVGEKACRIEEKGSWVMSCQQLAHDVQCMKTEGIEIVGAHGNAPKVAHDDIGLAVLYGG